MVRIRLGNRGTSASSGRGFRNSVLSGKPSIVGFLFGLPFFAMGVFFCWMTGLQPLLKVVQSSEWPTVEGIIQTSEVETRSSSDGTTYKINITFAYQYEGRSYEGGSYNFNTTASSGRKGKAKVVSRFPVGSKAVCWVNPNKPTEAVLSRDIPGLIFFTIPFSSIFILIGLIIMLASLGLLPRSWKEKVHSRHKPVSAEDSGESRLSPTAGSMKKLLGSVFFAAIWNTVTGIFLFQVIEDFQRGKGEWFPVLFLIPFVLVGIGVIILSLYYLLACFNPKFQLILSEGSPRLGESIQVRWEPRGSVSRLSNFSLILEGREAATYRRGTRSVTDRSTFLKEVLFQTDNPRNHASETIRLRIPERTMHSFNGGNNKIEWQLRITGDVKNWPDVNDAYSITIRPYGIQ